MSRVRDRYAAGQLALGTWASFGAPREVEALAAAGLDFVRIDGYKYDWPDEVVAAMVAACRKHGITPWGRVKSNPADIARYVDLGVEALTVPSVGSADEARAIVAAAAKRPADFLLGCQIESRAGLANLDEIVRVPGVDVIHSGRTDLAADIKPGLDQFDPQILTAEERIAAAARREGKIMALMYPLDARGEGYIKSWVARGVRIFALDDDRHMLRAAYEPGVARLRTLG